MKVKDLINELKKYNYDLEVTITDGYECIHYHTKNIEIRPFRDIIGSAVVDIGIGGNRIEGE